MHGNTGVTAQCSNLLLFRILSLFLQVAEECFGLTKVQENDAKLSHPTRRPVPKGTKLQALI